MFTIELAQAKDLGPNEKWEVGLCEFTCPLKNVGKLKPIEVIGNTNVLINKMSENGYFTRKQGTDVGKYSFVNRTITNWNQLPESLLASFPCKISTFRKRIKNVVTRKGIQVRGECK